MKSTIYLLFISFLFVSCKEGTNLLELNREDIGFDDLPAEVRKEYERKYYNDVPIDSLVMVTEINQMSPSTDSVSYENTAIVGLRWGTTTLKRGSKSYYFQNDTDLVLQPTFIFYFDKLYCLKTRNVRSKDLEFARFWRFELEN